MSAKVSAIADMAEGCVDGADGGSCDGGSGGDSQRKSGGEVKREKREAAAAAAAEGHPYDFDVCGPRNLPPPNWRDMFRSNWKDPNYRRMAIACFVQVAYLLELDRQDNRGESESFATKWYKPLKYKITQTLTDSRDGSIYGVVLEWDQAAALADFVLMRPSGAPKAVLALRGTVLKKATMKIDVQDDLRFLAWESLKGSVRYLGVYETLKSLAHRFGGGNVCVGGHSLGAGFALQVGKELAKEGMYVDCHLFNPPSYSIAMGWRTVSQKAGMLFKRMKESMPFMEQCSSGCNAAASEEAGGSGNAVRRKRWVPHLYLNNSDLICRQYNAPDGGGSGGAGDGSGCVENSGSEQKEKDDAERELAAKLFVMSKGPKTFFEAHGLQQWWTEGMELQLAMKHSKLINLQLSSLEKPPTLPDSTGR